MPLVDPGTSDFIRNLMMLTGQIQANRQSQVQNALATAAPGMTWEQLGITPKQFKAAFGRAPKPGEVVKPDTAEAAIDRRKQAMLAGMPPELAALFDASMLSREMGVPQVTTQGGLTAQAQANTTSSQAQARVSETQLKMVNEGLAALDAGPASVRERLGQERAFGKTAGTVQLEAAKEQSGIAQEAINQSVQKFAQEAIANPNHPLWKLTQQKLGINQVQALGAAATGMTQLLFSVADLNVRMQSAGADQNTAMIQAEASWAAEVGKQWKISPAALLAEKKRQEAGAPPSPGQVGQLVQTLTKLTTDAIVSEAMQAGDPQAQTYMQLIEGMRQVGNKNTLSAMSEVIRRLQARMVVTQRLGIPQNEAEVAAFKDAEAAVASRLPRLDANWFGAGGGVDVQFPGQQRTIGPQYSTPGANNQAAPMAPVIGAPQAPVPPTSMAPTTPQAPKNLTIQYPDGTPEESIRAFEEFANAFFQPVPAKP